ncbi:MAG TPA: ABC transporter permease [Longimicrobiales bacterium]
MMALRLLDIEWFKARHRAVFWVTSGFFVSMFLLFLGITQYRHAAGLDERPFSLPRDWLDLLRGPGGLGVLLITVAVVLLVASERTWRTQRQNVIDGLSRGQFFTGKLLLALLLVLIYWITPIVTGLVFAIFDGRPGYTDGTGPLLPVAMLHAYGGFFVHLIATAAQAFMFAIIASSSGSALALTFVFSIAQMPIFLLLSSRAEYWIAVARRAPTMVFDQLTNPAIWDPDRLAQLNEARQGLPPLLPGAEAIALALGYTALFVGIAWLAFRHRDL